MTHYTPDAEDTTMSLANMADVNLDHGAQYGGMFLTGVRDSLAEAIHYDQANGEEFRGADTHEVADGAVPIYTYAIWQTFTDLQAWQEDPSELGYDASDMEKLAQVCIYMVAERLIYALLERWEDDGEEDDDRSCGCGARHAIHTDDSEEV